MNERDIRKIAETCLETLCLGDGYKTTSRLHSRLVIMTRAWVSIN